MSRVQDIQTDDLALKNQYAQDMTNGDYAGMSNIISANPQLDTKIFDADKINDIADSLTAQQNNYFTNVPDYMAALEAQYNALINEFKNAHDWDVGEEYTRYNFVIYNELYYMYINETSSTGNLPTNTTYWKEIGLRGEQGAPGVGLNLRYAWSSVVNYNPLDLVFYNNASWVAKATNVNQAPSTTSQYWEIFVNHEPVGIESSTTQPTKRYLGQIWLKMKE